MGRSVIIILILAVWVGYSYFNNHIGENRKVELAQRAENEKKKYGNVDRVLAYMKDYKCYANYEHVTIQGDNGQTRKILRFSGEEYASEPNQKKDIGIASNLSIDQNFYYLASEPVRFYCAKGEHNILTTIVPQHSSFSKLDKDSLYFLLNSSAKKPFVVEKTSLKENPL